MNEKIIRASFDDETITVYQAYNKQIADAAVENQTLLSPFFKQSRMTWVKPSFLWMMYRCGFATKPNQEHVLAIKITRKGWEWALKNSCSSSFDSNVYYDVTDWKKAVKDKPVRIQWDPERDIFLNKLPYKSIQVGITGIAVEKYINEWIVEIKDITSYSKQVHKLISMNEFDQVSNFLPKENIYPFSYNKSLPFLSN